MWKRLVRALTQSNEGHKYFIFNSFISVDTRRSFGEIFQFTSLAIFIWRRDIGDFQGEIEDILQVARYDG